MGLPQPPAQMVYDIAAGLEEPVDVAYRYGYSASEWKTLEEHQPFRSAVAQARSELEKGGHAVRTKARWMTEILLEDLFFRMKQEGTTVSQLQESVRIMSRLGDLEPKAAVQGAIGGPASSIKIIFSSTPAAVEIGGHDASPEAPKVWSIPERKDDE
jgi:hypothetical protein